MLRGILQSAETSYTTHRSHFPYRQPREMKFGGDVLQMLTCLMVQPVCLWLFWVMSKKNEKTRLVSPGCMIFLSQVKKFFESLKILCTTICQCFYEPSATKCVLLHLFCAKKVRFFMYFRRKVPNLAILRRNTYMSASALGASHAPAEIK